MRGRADVRDELCYLYANGRETRPARFDVADGAVAEADAANMSTYSAQ